MTTTLFLVLVSTLVAQTAASDSAPTEQQLPSVEASSSGNYVFLQPRLRLSSDSLRVDGTVCRRANRSLLSPPRVQIDHLSSAGDVLETSFGYLPSLSSREDQRCGRFGGRLKTPPQPGDRIRICFARSKGSCPAP